MPEKKSKKSQYTPELTTYQRYEYFKKHIKETAKTTEEHTRRIRLLTERLGV